MLVSWQATLNRSMWRTKEVSRIGGLFAAERALEPFVPIGFKFVAFVMRGNWRQSVVGLFAQDYETSELMDCWI